MVCKSTFTEWMSVYGFIKIRMRVVSSANINFKVSFRILSGRSFTKIKNGSGFKIEPYSYSTLALVPIVMFWAPLEVCHY